MEFDDEIVEEAKALSFSQGVGIQQRIADMILSKSDNVLLEALGKRSRRPAANQAIVEYTKAFFLVLGPPARRCQSSRAASLLLRLVLKFLSIIHTEGFVIDRKVTDCLDFLLQEMDVLPCCSLPSIVELIILHLENPNQDGEHHTLQLLPRCFFLIASSSQQVEVQEANGNIRLSSGSDYLDSCLKRILSSSWSRPVLATMTSMLREFPLSQSYLVQFLAAIFVQMKNADPVDLPALLYQLLLLASKDNKRTILTGILSVFSEMFAASSKTAKTLPKDKKFTADSCKQVEGTILLHINFAVKQDPTLGQELLYLLRSQTLPVTSFIISVVLSIARIQRFEEPALALLNAAVLKSCQDLKQSRNSMCTPSALKKQCFEDVKCIEQAFMQTVRSTAFGWDHIIPSLVSIGFMMIESVQTSNLVPTEDWSKHHHTLAAKDVGMNILTIAFEVHEMARDEIIEQSKCRIIGLKPEQSLPIIRMIGQLVQNYPHLMVDHVSRLKECLDYFTFLHPASGSSLIHSICPLFSMSSDLQGYTVLVLRKAMFSREAKSRMTALRGFLSLLIAERSSKAHSESDSLSNFSSEASCSQQDRTRFKRSSGLLQELLGLLRRCLLQQADIRETLYRGLLKLVFADPATAENSFNLLWPHFCRYYTQEDTKVTLHVDACLKLCNGAAVIEEPLDQLIHCIYILLTLQPSGEEGQNSLTDTFFGFSLSQDQEISRISAADSLKNAFVNISKSLRYSSLSDLNLDKTRDFTHDSNEGKLNLKKAQMYLSIYEVLISSAAAEMAASEDCSEAELELHAYVSIYDALEHILLKHGSGSSCNKLRPLESVNSTSSGKLSSGASLVVERRVPLLNPANTAFLLQYALTSKLQDKPRCSNAPSQGDGQGSLQKGEMIFKHRVLSLAIRTCLRHVRAAACDTDFGESVTGLKQLSGDWKILGKPILQALTVALTVSPEIFSWSIEKLSKDTEKHGRGKRSGDELGEGLVLTMVKCVEEICRLANKKDGLTEVFANTASHTSFETTAQGNKFVGDDANLLTAEHFIHEFLLNKVHPLLEQLLHRSQFREFEVLSGVLLGLGSRLQPCQMKIHGLWAESKAKNLKITLNAAAKALVKLSVCLLPPPDDLVLSQSFSQELMKVTGTEEEDSTEVSVLYPVISTGTRNAVAGFLLQHLEASLADSEWLISKLKLQPVATTVSNMLVELQPHSHAEASRLKLEAALHTRLEAVVLVLSNFVQMSVNGALAEHFLRVCLRLYKCLAAATKVCIAPKGFKQALPSNKFQALAEVTCKSLTAPLYTFMAVLQRDQQENCQAKGSMNKIKREVRTIPNLVYYVEDYERYLIQLSKLTKVNLLRHAKRSTARDFKILENGKKCKGPANNQNEKAREEENADEGAEAEAGNSGQESGNEDEQHRSQHPVISNEAADGGEDEDDEEERRPVRIRRPTEKRRKKAVVQDSDDEEHSDGTGS